MSPNCPSGNSLHPKPAKLIREKTRVCPECKGEKYIVYPGIFDARTETCTRCGGTGKVPR